MTGSLNASVAMWLLEDGRLQAPYVARQGTALGRAGRVHVTQDADGTIWVGGAHGDAGQRHGVTAGSGT